MRSTFFSTLKITLLILTVTLFCNTAFAQTTNGIFFQALARDNFSNPAKDRKIFVQATIIQNSATGTKVLIEEHQANTDVTGIFSISIGNGTRIGGTSTGLTTIDWSKGPYYLNLKVAITPFASNSGWDYTKELVDMGTTSFGAVPFALYSASAAKVDDKLNSTDTTKMLSVYAKALSVKNLETEVAGKFAASDIVAYTKKSYSDSVIAKKLNIADSSNYVTPTQLASKTFDQTPIIDAIALKANASDVLSNTISIAANTASITSNTAAIALKANTSDVLVNTTNIASNTASITSNTAAIALKANASDVLVNTTNIAANTGSITSNTAAIALKANASDVLANTTNIAANTASITTMTSELALKITGASPTLVTPNLGTPSALTLTNATGLPLSTGVAGVLSVENGGTGLTSLGSDGQVLTTTGSGTLTWTTPSSGGGSDTYTIGLNSSLGGYVFYVTPNGKHGLVVETYEFSSTWFYANSELIKPINHSSDGMNFMDWRLPTYYELELMYNIKGTLSMNTNSYWCSTLETWNYGANAFYRRFSDGVWYDAGRDLPNYIKAVRAF